MATDVSPATSTPPPESGSTLPINQAPSQSQPRPPLTHNPSSTSTSIPPAKTPVTFHPTAHLDPSAYVRGTSPIHLGANTLIHPRSHLLSLHGPLTIHEGCIISEKVVVGGPIPPPPATTPTTPSSEAGASSNPTTIHAQVHVHPSATILSGATIHAYSIIESHVTVQHDVVVGAHSKVCAGVVLASSVPEWTVVFGRNGECRRARRKGGVSNGDSGVKGVEALEKARLQIMGVEREGTMAILRRTSRAGVGTGPARAKR